MKPLYCIYCTEPQRSFWKQSHANGDFEGCQTGCLLADANDVCVTTTKLDEIEDRCIPWHYLFQRVDFARCKSDGLFFCSRCENGRFRRCRQGPRNDVVEGSHDRGP